MDRYARERTPTRIVPSGATSTTTSVKCSAVSIFSMARCMSPRCSGVRVAPPPVTLYWPLSTWMLVLAAWNLNDEPLGVLGFSQRDAPRLVMSGRPLVPPQRRLAYPVPRTPRTPMRSCSTCRLPLTDTEHNVCCYHKQDTTVTWADCNKRFCDWLHREAGRR
jgi:hypothetical protein